MKRNSQDDSIRSLSRKIGSGSFTLQDVLKLQAAVRRAEDDPLPPHIEAAFTTDILSWNERVEETARKIWASKETDLIETRRFLFEELRAFSRDLTDYVIASSGIPMEKAVPLYETNPLFVYSAFYAPIADSIERHFMNAFQEDVDKKLEEFMRR